MPCLAWLPISLPRLVGAPSSLADDLFDIPQQSRAIHDRCPRVLDHPLLAEDSLRIDEKEGPVRVHRFLIEHAEAADDLPLGNIAEQRKWQAERVGEGLLGKRIVGADAEVLDTQGLEPVVVGLPGRQVRRSGRLEIRAIELDQDPFLAPEVAERNVEPSCGRQLEVGHLVTHLDGPGAAGHGQPTGQQQA